MQQTPSWPRTQHLTLPRIIRKQMTIVVREKTVPSLDGEGTPFNGFHLEEHVGFLLRRAHQRHVALFLEAVETHALTPTQFAALYKAVEVGRVTQNRLGRLTAMDPATIQGVVRGEDGSPIQAHVDIRTLKLRLLANEAGEFQVNVPPGIHSVSFSAEGYLSQTKTISTAAGEVTIFNVDLHRK